MKMKALMCGLLGTVALGAGATTIVLSNNTKKLEPASAAVPTDTRRVWILNNDNWWTDNNYYVHAFNENGNVDTSKVTMVLNDYYYGLGYVDVTLAGAATSLDVIVVNSWGDYGQTVTLSLPALGGEDVIWMNSGGTWDASEIRNNRNASLGTTNGFSGEQLAVILSNYHTCKATNTDGYNAYPQMETNFFLKTAQSAFSTLVYGQSKYTCQDYVDGMYARYNANK